MNLIPEEKYTDMIKFLPVLCVDLLIQNESGEYLLIRRANEPKKGQWWPIGGRVMKGETLEAAAIRKIREETALNIDRVQPIGYFETVADTHPFGQPIKYHAVSVVFSAVVHNQQRIKLDDQSTEWNYFADLPTDFIVRPFLSSGNYAQVVKDTMIDDNTRKP